ncbi:MAG: Fur family transcriptional regulator [Gemmatimonadales bacterium]|jgi:Fur family ferric uptake transcriptional regulator
MTETNASSPSQIVIPGPPTGCAMLMMDLFRSYLHQNRLPLTHQREAIAMALFEAEHHQSVDDLADLLRDRGEQVGKATIYRTLNLLVEAGLARELDFGEGFKRYEHQAGETQHDYLICTNCGRVARFRQEAMDRLQAEIAAELSFAVQSRMLKIYGLCDSCAGTASSGQMVESSASVGAGPETG